jgi:hypothetical protein
VKETSAATQTGTGSIALSGIAPTGWQTFDSAYDDAEYVPYGIDNLRYGGSDVELGIGQWQDDDTFDRLYVTFSTNSNALVNLAATIHDVYVSTPGSAFDGKVSVKYFGATGDGTTDDVLAVQAAIDAVQEMGGGTVYFPPGTYRITTSITLREFVSLKGEMPTRSGNSPVTIDHDPPGGSVDLFETESPRATGNYATLGEISGFYITGDPTFSKFCFDLDSPVGLAMRDICISNNFLEGINIEKSMRCKFENIRIEGATDVCVRFNETGADSTTTHFDTCYLINADNAVICSDGQCTNILFSNVIMTAINDDAVVSNGGNSLTFVGCHLENCPVADTPASLFKLGVTGAEKSISIIGGQITGRSAGAATGSYAFEVNGSLGVYVNNVYISKVEKVLSTTASTKNVVLSNISLDADVTYEQNDINDPSKVKIINFQALESGVRGPGGYHGNLVAEEDLTLIGATTDTTLAVVPANSRILAVLCCVDTEVQDEGAQETWSAAFTGGSVTALGGPLSGAVDTKITKMLDHETVTATTAIRFTPGAAPEFDLGVIRVKIFYETLEAIGDN